MNTGFLLALEGIDGSGKSTVADGIAAALRADGRTIVATSEPTRGTWGRRIRKMAASGELLPPEKELRWFLEDRREHVREVVRPALIAGEVVLTDRYFLSTVAYQGARGLDWLKLLSDAEAEFPVPDLALIFEIDAAAGLARAHDRAGSWEPAFEDVEFLRVVAEVYATIERPWIQRIEADREPAAVLADALAQIQSLLQPAV